MLVRMLPVRQGTEKELCVEPFKIHVAEEVLGELRARLRCTRWTDEVPGMGWEQGTILDWLQHLVSYWTNEFDWRAWERRLGALDHSLGRASASCTGVPLRAGECRLSSRTAGRGHPISSCHAQAHGHHRSLDRWISDSTCSCSRHTETSGLRGE